jgi:hypothetical protein
MRWKYDAGVGLRAVERRPDDDDHRRQQEDVGPADPQKLASAQTAPRNLAGPAARQLMRSPAVPRAGASPGSTETRLMTITDTSSTAANVAPIPYLVSTITDRWISTAA